MCEMRLGAVRGALIVGLAALTVGLGLGRAGRLTYHEAFVAESAREMIAGRDVLVPSMGGRPWLEKPPLAIWLVALGGWLGGAVSEVVARAPSAVAATLLALGIGSLAARRYGAAAGLLAGLIQATTSWTVLRGRLAEADMLLAGLVTWILLAFDRVRAAASSDRGAAGYRWWRLAFWLGLGVSTLIKGIGFGAALVGVTVVLVLVWDRDLRTPRRLVLGRGAVRDWAVAGLLALAWPALVLLRYPQALGFWAWHLTGRLAERPEHFASGPWWQYGPALLGQLLPWTPLALVGAGRSLVRAVRRDQQSHSLSRWERVAGGWVRASAPLSAAASRDGDRLLCAWAVGPVALLSLATVKNPHYIIHALAPWSIWAALSLLRLGARLERRGSSAERLRRGAWLGFGGLGLSWALVFAVLGPWLDRRGQGAEWAFYEAAGRCLRSGEPLALLYDDWDRLPYPTPFGPIPHDLGVRLYYLGRPACWRFGVAELAERPPAGEHRSPFAVIGRDRDVPALERLGRVETLARGPVGRARMSKVDDRTFCLYRVTPEPVLGREEVAARR
jgi:4-amino-4-deoxy-L-arabinose transferase-like glycosyltransferase